METVRLEVGTLTVGNNVRLDTRKPVEFEGEELAALRTAGTGRDGKLTDTRGIVETLYKAGDGRLVVHVEEWSHWQGEPSTYTLHEVSEADLQPGGCFEDIGAEAGYGRPLTLDEAVTPLHVLVPEQREVEPNL
jgi:hypothetical protein